MRKIVSLLLFVICASICWGQTNVVMNWSTGSCDQTYGILHEHWTWAGDAGLIYYSCHFDEGAKAPPGSGWQCVSIDEMTYDYSCNNRCCTWIDVSPQPTVDIHYATTPCDNPQPTSNRWILLHNHS
jgi:hypothetical protein